MQKTICHLIYVEDHTLNWYLWLSFKKEGFVKYHSLHQTDILKLINFVSSTSWEANVTNTVAVYARKEKTKKHIEHS